MRGFLLEKILTKEKDYFKVSYSIRPFTTKYGKTKL